MVDNLVLALTHGLLLLTAWRLLSRPGLQDDAPASRGFGSRKDERAKLARREGKHRA
jgi:hypothetical protein